MAEPARRCDGRERIVGLGKHALCACKALAQYLPTERAVANRGYSAEPYSYSTSPAGGATLVRETLKELRRLRSVK